MMVLRGALQGFSGKTLPSVYAYPFVRFYQYAETQIALETVVIEQSFGIPVVVLQAYILIAFFRQPECRFEEYVGIEDPPRLVITDEKEKRWFCVRKFPATCQYPA